MPVFVLFYHERGAEMAPMHIKTVKNGSKKSIVRNHLNNQSYTISIIICLTI